MSYRTVVHRRRRSTAQSKHKHANSHRHSGAPRRKLEIDVPAGWIDCDLPQHQLIPRAQAVSHYRLKPNDLNKIAYRSGVSIDGHPIRLYHERSVEGLAWDRYGGPCGFWKWLKRLYDRHLNEHGDATTFSIPFSYQPGQAVSVTPTTPMAPASGDLRLDAPYGWITDIPTSRPMSRHISIDTAALRMYLLEPRYLDGVPFEDRLI